MEIKRRSQADRTAATRAALIAAARPLFTEQGYAGVSTEAIARAASVSRGALYHQFADKADLFEAVFETLEGESTEKIALAVLESGATSPTDQLLIGARAWLDVCEDPQVREIILVQAPSVLGWARWREIAMEHGLGLVDGILSGAVEAGLLPPQPTRPLAHLLIGAIEEGALYVTRAEDQVTARAEIESSVERLVRAVTLP